jgi:transcriptional regulator with XRE-family HTH domain
VDDAQRLRAARAWADISQPELGRRIGRPNKSYIARREDGSYGLSASDKIAIAHACGLPVQWFYVDIVELLAAIPLEAQAGGEVPRRLPPAPPAEGHEQAPEGG